jgi:alpha-1,3-glucosyltransferase
MKHLFVYLAPLVGLYLLKGFCLSGVHNVLVSRIFIIVVAIIIPVILVFSAFFLQADGVSQVKQMYSRLFPFQRGLIHAYWAPNFWAIYCGLDKTLALLAKQLGK